MSLMQDDLSTAGWLDVGACEDVPLRGARLVKTSRGDIAIFRTADEQFFALDDRCPHLGGPLSQGIVQGRSVTCPLHNWVISLESGKAQGADEGCTRTVAVKVRDGRILLSWPGLANHAA